MRSLEFTLSILAVVADVVTRMLKTQVTLGNISRVLLNLTKRYLQCSKTPPPSQCSRSQQSYFLFRSSVRAASHHNFVTCLIGLVGVVICIFSWEEFFDGTFEDCIGFLILTIAPFCFRISTR